VTVRGVPVKRVRAARVLASGRELEFAKAHVRARRMFNSDPFGELAIRIPETSSIRRRR